MEKFQNQWWLVATMYDISRIDSAKQKYKVYVYPKNFGVVWTENALGLSSTFGTRECTFRTENEFFQLDFQAAQFDVVRKLIDGLLGKS